mmetsp:Transcript_49171/g.98616  ORF Transcript_49171/g.98616 Transcript_49171/m.98616 type:complete len:238 (-) Transcript_49171:237-950(-)
MVLVEDDACCLGAEHALPEALASVAVRGRCGGGPRAVEGREGLHGVLEGAAGGGSVGVHRHRHAQHHTPHPVRRQVLHIVLLDVVVGEVDPHAVEGDHLRLQHTHVGHHALHRRRPELDEVSSLEGAEDEDEEACDEVLQHRLRRQRNRHPGTRQQCLQSRHGKTESTDDDGGCDGEGAPANNSLKQQSCRLVHLEPLKCSSLCRECQPVAEDVATDDIEHCRADALHLTVARQPRD